MNAVIISSATILFWVACAYIGMCIAKYLMRYVGIHHRYNGWVIKFSTSQAGRVHFDARKYKGDAWYKINSDYLSHYGINDERLSAEENLKKLHEELDAEDDNAFANAKKGESFLIDIKKAAVEAE